MSGSRRGRRCARWAAVAALAGCVASCSSSRHDLPSLDRKVGEWDATVDRTVRDPVRAARVKALGAQLAELQRTMLGKFEALVRDYGSTPEAFDRLLDAASTENVRQAERIWSDRAELLAQVRAEEWSAIAAGARADAAKDAAKAHKEKTE